MDNMLNKACRISATYVHNYSLDLYPVFSAWQWKLHLFELEEEMKIDPPIKYVLYQVFMLNLSHSRYQFFGHEMGFPMLK